MNKFQLHGKYQIIYSTNIDYNATHKQANKPDSGVVPYKTDTRLIRIHFKNLGGSPVLISPNRMIQITIASEKEEEEILEQLSGVLVPLEGEKLYLEEVKRICSLKDSWSIFQSGKRGEHALSHIKKNYSNGAVGEHPLLSGPYLLYIWQPTLSFLREHPDCLTFDRPQDIELG